MATLEDTDKRVDLLRLQRFGPRYVQVPGQNRALELPAEQFRTLVRVLYELYQGESSARGGFPAARAPALLALDEAFERGGTGFRAHGGVALRARSRGLVVTHDVEAEDVPASTALRATLRPYQAQGFAWLQRLRAHGAGCV